MKKHIVTIVGIIFTAPLSVNAEVESMSLENFRNVDGSRYWEVVVNCTGDESGKVIKRSVSDDSLWCSSDDSSLCNKTKFALSESLCDTSYPTPVSDVVAEQAVSPATVATAPQENSLSESADDNIVAPSAIERKTALLREQVLIEEQRILIEQKRLELIKQELALKKQIDS